ncbi:MAG: hypothetical protein U0401_12410 [Anaerolineae bacterium]
MRVIPGACHLRQAVGNKKDGVVRQVSLAIVNHQTLFAKVSQPVGGTITIVGLRLAFVGNGDVFENRLLLLLQGVQMLL